MGECLKISELNDGRRLTVQSSSASAIDVGVVNSNAEFYLEWPLNDVLRSIGHPNYYLRHTSDDNYCAYRMDIEPKTNFEIVNKTSIGRDAYGLKTNFAINKWAAGPFDLVILDNGMALTSDEIDSDYSWYTVGRGHFAAIRGYRDIIERLVWQTALLYFVPELTKSIMDMATSAWPQEMESDESLFEIAIFMDWLFQYDPALYDKVAFRIDQNTEDRGNMTFCELQLFENAYAYAQNGGIIILPAGIAELKNDEYEFMALVLEHELSHNRIRESGLITPSEQLFFKGLNNYIDENQLYIIPGLAEYLTKHAQCQVQALLLEDEIVATYSETLSPSAASSYELADSYLLLDYLESQIYNPDVYPPEMLDIHYQFVKNALKALDMQKNP